MNPSDWQKHAKANQKKYARLLDTRDKNRILSKLPELHEEAFSKIDCLTCANCCKNHSPRFKQPEIKRISKVLGMKEGEFAITYLRLDNEGDYVTKKSPCPFLDTDNTCKIYDDRPSDCRRYPYTDEDVFYKRPLLTLKNATICPAVYYVLEKLEKVV
jgi:uncharacterized protein